MPQVDLYGRLTYSSRELARFLYTLPDLDLQKFVVNDPAKYIHGNKLLHTDFPPLKIFNEVVPDSREEFDKELQRRWFMPDSYKQLDIAKWLLGKCKTEHELQRVGEELLLYQENDLFDLLRFLKYLVDTMRENNVLWGVGRGSSVASYVLYLIGVHRIDSIYYDLDIREFLR